MKRERDLALEPILEAVFSAAEEPLSIARIAKLFPEEGRPERDRIEAAIERLAASYEEPTRGVELVKVAQGYRLQTRAQYSTWIERLYQSKPPKLSRALLETLAIIAYRQPVSRGDIQEIRGVSVSSDMMQRLIERQWVKKIGVREVPGRPGIYGTTNEFLAYFNLTSLQQLPHLNEPRALDEIAREMNMFLEPTHPEAGTEASTAASTAASTEASTAASTAASTEAGLAQPKIEADEQISATEAVAEAEARVNNE